jgi:hypothetical protein
MIDRAKRWYPHFMVWSARLSRRIGTTSLVSGSFSARDVAARFAKRSERQEILASFGFE